MTNLGNAYSTSSGSFTAPINGYYFFHIFATTFGDSETDLALLVNNEVLCGLDASNNYQQGTCSAVVQLNVGDVVNVKAVAGTAELYTGEVGKAIGFSSFLYLAL